ncbi:hypothetical protein E0493_19655 [Roseomonas sp. M0104]|uniref:Flagellar protein FlgN n=1 Tax=Teichococcus coralli TaxID=2545983 RepID=A0A845BFE1_9PROT|nr:hypothetical protein [Pseudoroseomonas coralli]MXP65568.1 hypothetical protein [Pseudoroseomonas coralli]
MSALLDAANRLRMVLLQEAAAARQAMLPELVQLIGEKRVALSDLAAAGMPRSEAERQALAAMMRAAEENALALGAVAGALEGVRDRLRRDVSEAADPGVYGPAAARRRPLRHTLAASLDQQA